MENTFDEQQEVIDHIVNANSAMAMRQVADEFHVTMEDVYAVLNGEDDENPMYDRYYEILEGLIQDAEHS